MTVLTVVTWLWGDKFGTLDMLKLCNAVHRNVSQEHNFVCITDRPDKEMDFVPASFDYVTIDPRLLPLTKIKGCFARLCMFDPNWQKSIGVNEGDRLACVDLDTVITGPLDPLLDRPEPFVIMQNGNASNPCPFNGALMMLRAGAHPEVWTDFTLDAAAQTAHYEFPDDQGWIWHKLPNAAGWKCGIDSGVFVFRKPGWPSFDRKMKRGGDDLPKGARLVTFSGGRSPQKYIDLNWIKENWRVE